MLTRYIILYSAIFTTIFALSQSCKTAEEPDLRWDKQMIAEAPIWQKLLAGCWLGSEERWPEKKSALEQITDKWPDSQWADDAALMLAGGKAAFEDDPNGAIDDSRQIIRMYPDDNTVVVQWAPQQGSVLDPTWVHYARALVLLNPEGTIRKSYPFSSPGRLSFSEKEQLAYFEHLDKYPRKTATVAKLIIAQIYAYNNDLKHATGVLENIVDPQQYQTLLKADAAAGSTPHGTYIRRGLGRTQFHAYMSLITLYKWQGESEKAIATADEFSSLITNPPNYRLLKVLGDWYAEHGLKTKAKTQYKHALPGLEREIELNIERNKHLDFAGPAADDPSKGGLVPNLLREKEELERLIAEYKQ